MHISLGGPGPQRVIGHFEQSSGKWNIRYRIEDTK